MDKKILYLLSFPCASLVFPSDGLALSCPLPEDFQLEKLVVFCWLPGHFLPFGKLLAAIMTDLIHFEVSTIFKL